MLATSAEVITDSMSERELQRMARTEMAVALDVYLKRKRIVSLALEQNSNSIHSSDSLSTVKESQSNVQSSKSNSVDGAILKEPLRTYDEAFSTVIIPPPYYMQSVNVSAENEETPPSVKVQQLLSGEAWRKVSKDVEYRPFFGDINSFNDPEYGIELLPGRQKPKVVISVTMFNESFKELNDTLRGIADNIENLPEFSYGLTIDDIVVFVIIDGRDKMSNTIFQVRE